VAKKVLNKGDKKLRNKLEPQECMDSLKKGYSFLFNIMICPILIGLSLFPEIVHTFHLWKKIN
jgi:hypothetical protein